MKPWLAFIIAAGWLFLPFKSTSATYYVDIHSPAPAPPYADLFTAATNIQDAVDLATNGDLVLVNDGVYQLGFRVTQETLAPNLLPRTIPGTNRIVLAKAITVRSLNGPAATLIDGGGIYRCAYLTNGATLSGFTLTNGWAGYVISTPGPRGPVLTTNALSGGGVEGATALGLLLGPNLCTVSNCVLAANTALGNGGGAYGCHLVNCRLTGNSASSGGGADSSILLDCCINSNWTAAPSTVPLKGGRDGAGYGGGIYQCWAVNCLIVSNTAFTGGGAFYPGSLVNCTVVGNHASFVGGVDQDSLVFPSNETIHNCIIYFNTADTNDNCPANFEGDHCCTFPLPANGNNDITNDPALTDPAAGDFSLQSDSPCINSGNNLAVTNATDFCGNRRAAGGTVDIGAYEYPSPASVLSYAWARQYGLPTDGRADYVDSDGDGMSNWQEFLAGTNPTNAASCLTMLRPEFLYQGSIIVEWQSVATRNYFLQRSSDLTSGFSTLQTNIAGMDGTIIYFDDTAAPGGTYFYRVGVQ